MLESEATTSSSSDDDEVTDYFSKPDWLWNREHKLACFACWEPGTVKSKKRKAGTTKSKKQQAEAEDSASSSTEAVVKKDTELRRCNADKCKILFHENCFLECNEGDFLPEMNVRNKDGDACFEPRKEGHKWYCPRHECNACHQELLRTRSQYGSLITCVRCAFAWHKSCEIVGSHHVNRRLDKYVLCPRHNKVGKASKVYTPYCVGCEKKLDNSSKIDCPACVRSFCKDCWNKDAKTEITVEEKGNADDQLDDGNEEPTCGYCTCYDLPRIGDFVLAAYKRRLFPARAVHAEQLPRSLEKNTTLTDSLEQPGYVLIQWIEGATVPNYAVVTFRDIVAMPKTFKCSFWKTIKEQNIYEAVGELYAAGKVVSGLQRPLPTEVKEFKAPNYRRIEANEKGKMARSSHTADYCECNQPTGGLRCTKDQVCYNRVDLAECPVDCDEAYARRMASKNAERRGNNGNAEKCAVEIPEGRCVNNFLRNRRQEDDEKIMEERITEKKMFGVFSKANIAKGTELTEYLGEMKTKEAYNEITKLYVSFNNLEMSYYGISVGQYCLDGRRYGNFARSMNHSCDPNCQVTTVSVDGYYRLLISAVKNIFVGEELTFDYATLALGGLDMPRCMCGSDRCRSVMGRRQGDGRKTITQQIISGTAKRGRRRKRGRPAKRDQGLGDSTRNATLPDSEENGKENLKGSTTRKRLKKKISPRELEAPQ